MEARPDSDYVLYTVQSIKLERGSDGFGLGFVQRVTIED